MYQIVFKIFNPDARLMRTLKEFKGVVEDSNRDYAFVKFRNKNPNYTDQILKSLKNYEYEYIVYQEVEHNSTTDDMTLSVCVDDSETGSMIW